MFRVDKQNLPQFSTGNYYDIKPSLSKICTCGKNGKTCSSSVVGDESSILGSGPKSGYFKRVGEKAAETAQLANNDLASLSNFKPSQLAPEKVKQLKMRW